MTPHPKRSHARAGIGMKRLAHDEHGPPPQPRRQLDQALPRQPRTGPGQLLGVLEQPERAFRQRLIAAGQADQRPGVARTQRPPGVPAGHQPAFETRALDAHGPHPVLVIGRWGGDQVA